MRVRVKDLAGRTDTTRKIKAARKREIDNAHRERRAMLDAQRVTKEGRSKQ